VVARDFFGEIMTRTLQTCIGAAVLIVVLSMAWLCYCASWAVLEWGHAGQAATESMGKLGTAADGINAVTARLNGPHGTLTMLDEDVGALKSLIVHADLVARHEQQQIGKLDQQEETLFADLHGMAASGTELTQALTVDARTANDTILAGKAGVQSFTLAVKDADAVVNDPALAEGLDSLSQTAANTARITDDTAKVTHHFEQEIDTPAKHHWWTPVKTIWGITWQALMLAK